MNIGGLVGALLPVFFVLALGYGAGKRHTFDGDQAAGLIAINLFESVAAKSHQIGNGERGKEN